MANATKVYDLAVKTGEYTTGGGEKKARWQNVGAVMEKNDGGRFIMLDRTFNPAGVPNPDNGDRVLLSMFEPKPRDGAQPRRADHARTQPADRPHQPAPRANGLEDDDIPF